ncbi:radical SAM superfamily protein [Wolffia australiana]
MLRSIFDAEALRSEFEAAGISPKFVPLIWRHVLANPNCALEDVLSLPSVSYPILCRNFRPMTSSVTSAVDSSDGTTTKLLVRLQNGSCVEAVIMRYDTRLGKYNGKPRPGGPRSTLCVSSQVGCKMGCKFCATGTMGFKSNLSSGEIVEQLVHALRLADIRNVVFMGMGEPLNNYSAVVEAVKVMTGSPFQLSPKRITISTVGIIHGISKLQIDLPNINLAVSLHAPDQETRCQIMPAARAFPISRLLESLRVYQKTCGQKILIEYIMLDGVNDQEQHAHSLGKVMEPLQVVVNLIPFNPIDGGSGKFRSTPEETVLNFQKILRGVYNIRTTVRKQMGQDISGACGQLVLNHSLPDIEDLRL